MKKKVNGIWLARAVAYFAIVVGIVRFLDYLGYLNYCTYCRENPDYALAMIVQAVAGGLLVLILLKFWFPKEDLRIEDD